MLSSEQAIYQLLIQLYHLYKIVSDCIGALEKGTIETMNSTLGANTSLVDEWGFTPLDTAFIRMATPLTDDDFEDLPMAR
jgi:hypothetical protein